LIQISNSETRSCLEEPKSSAKPLIKSWSPTEHGDLKKIRELWSKDVDDAQDAMVNHHLSASIWFVLQNPLYPDERISKGSKGVLDPKGTNLLLSCTAHAFSGFSGWETNLVCRHKKMNKEGWKRNTHGLMISGGKCEIHC
jgi:hypothetical protein